MRPALGPLQLTSLGVGAIIGAGLFFIIGVVAKDKAGAATMLSFVFAGPVCARSQDLESAGAMEKE